MSEDVPIVALSALSARVDERHKTNVRILSVLVMAILAVIPFLWTMTVEVQGMSLRHQELAKTLTSIAKHLEAHVTNNDEIHYGLKHRSELRFQKLEQEIERLRSQQQRFPR